MTQTAAEETRRRGVALLLALATVVAVVAAALNFAQRTQTIRPDDGIDWAQTSEGVQASVVWQDTPGDLAKIRPGDILLAVNNVEIKRPIDVTRQLFRAAPGSQVTYTLLRFGRTEPHSVSVTVVPSPDPFSLYGFLEFVGVLYLGIGLFILVRRWNGPHALHFYLFCLASFVFYSFSYSGRFNDFDWGIYWADVVARLLQPALFLHFALAFPRPKPWFERRRWLFALLYLPVAVLLVGHIWAIGLGPRTIERLNELDRIEFVYVAALFLAAAAVFEYTYRRSEDPVLTQQMKWVTRGTWLAILPFTAFYVLPFSLQTVPNEWMKLSSLALVFIPLNFGYAIIRFRLMDVDIIFRRGMAYTLATSSVLALYFVVTLALAELFQREVGFGAGGVIIAIIFAAVFFQPIKDWMQVQLDRQFYRERFDYRRTLEEFGRELSSEVRLDRLMEKLLDRLARTLPVEQMAIFLEDEKEPGVFRLARAQGLGRRPQLAFPAPPENAARSTVTLDDAWSRTALPPADVQALARSDLYYLVPCCVQDRTIGFLALGKTVEGSLLSSEDVTLLESLADYLAVAMENARLYRSVEQKAEQIAQLQEFSENILESTSVGLVALDPEEKIESWNSTMERLTGRPRADVLGRPAAAIFPPELVRELEARRGEAVQSSLYKFYLADQTGRRRVLNIAIAPLVSKQGQPIGRLLVFDDITERIQLESQLLQNEKLTSVGLLAAGVAHEVNTPLAVISNYAQLLAKQTPSGDARAAMIEKIIKQTFRASEIISGLLNFSRTGPSEFTRVDLNRTLADTLALVEPQLRGSGVEIQSTLEQALPPVQGDSSKLQQVFLNLFFNARDAMPQGGRLSVCTRCASAKVEVEISDTGVGIPQEDVDKIFDPFFTTKSTGRGTGLGLAITYGIMQEHHGSIEVRSRPGQGTTFVLVFPAPSRAAAGQPAVAGKTATAGKPAVAGKLQGGNRG